MRKIKIDKFTRPNFQSSRLKDKVYKVQLGNGEVELFTSEKSVKSFLAETNRKLTEITFELNEIYIDVFREYRQCYFHVESKKIPVLVAGIEKAFYMALTRSNYDNGNYFIFTHLKYIADSLLLICRIIIKLNQEKKYFPTVQIMRILIKRINYILPEIQNYNN